MTTFSKAAREKMAARAIRAAKQDARGYKFLSQNTLGDRPTAGHLAEMAKVEAKAAKTLKRQYFGAKR